MHPARPYAIREEGAEGRDITILLSGRLTVEGLEGLAEGLAGLRERRRPPGIALDLASVEAMDSAGAIALFQFKADSEARSIPVRFLHRSDRLRGIMDSLELPPRVEALSPGRPAARGYFQRVGEASIRFGDDVFRIMAFWGELLSSLLAVAIHPGSLRGEAVLSSMKRVGVDGLPIVALISALLGMIIAFMSSLQLRPFGADAYVASLVGFAMVRELGPIMTAILVAGRTGSAFAAEIGSMMINEEVDALATMGFDPMRFLAVPKVLAAVAVVPLLTLYADLFGILGGLFVGIAGMDLTVYAYMQQTMQSFRIFDIVSSFLKSMVFALCIAGMACQRGFEVRGGAEAVGSATTSAVVSGIFLIILTDSVFAIVLYYIK